MTGTDATALLVIDVQQGILDRFPFGAAYLDHVHGAVETARAIAIPVIYVRIAFRPGAPEVGAHLERFAAFARTMPEDDPTSAIHPAVAPRPDEVTITRRRPSAFTGTDLDQVLRAQAIDHLVLTGNATSGGILFTLLAAADRDYRLTVLSDCCADFDQSVHDLLTTRIFPAHADVTTLDQWRVRPDGHRETRP
jgi:nicotinamidase-related amidase